MADSLRMSDTLQTINPATGEELMRYPMMSDSDVTSTIEKSHAAFLKWRHETPEKRAQVIKGLGKALRDNKEELAKLMTQEMGKMIAQGRQEVDLCAGICDWTAENGPDAFKAEERELSGGGKGLVTYAPLGVIYGIQPWNFPTYQVIRYAIANLMAGNSVLLKHAENVTGSGLMIEKILNEGGLPENLFSVLKPTMSSPTSWCAA